MTDAETMAFPQLRQHAHDIRNLFGAIASARHLIEDTPDTAWRAQLLDAIEDAAMRGGALTTQLLLVDSRNVEVFSPAIRLQRLVPLLRSIVGFDARLVLGPVAGDDAVRADGDHFDHALIELVTNARRAISAGGTIRIRLRARGGRVRLIVADDGCGMRRQDLERLRAGGGRPGAHGAGFGLVRDFVAAAHGRLAIRSAPQRGTAVMIDLSTTPVPDDAGGPAPA